MEPSQLVRVAAVGDLHMRLGHTGRFRRFFEAAAARADLLLLAGDLTQHGTVAEANVVAGEVRGLPLPVVGVLGNHDHLDGRPEDVADVLTDAGVTVLDYSGALVTVGGYRVGIAGGMGWCDQPGQPGSATADTDRLRLTEALTGLDGDVRIALTHYAPVSDTLAGERPAFYPKLGSQQLGEAIDAGRADLVVHGHAHHGVEQGQTRAGVPVRNVARPVIRAEYRVYRLSLPPGRSGVATAPDRRLAGLGRWWLHRSAFVATRALRLPRPPRPSGSPKGRGLS